MERRLVRLGRAGHLGRAASWPRSGRPRPGCPPTRPPPRRSSPAGGCCRTTASSTGPCSGRTRPPSRCATPRQLAAHAVRVRPGAGSGSSSADLGKRDPDARLNLLLTDGSASSPPAGTTRSACCATGDGVAVASEPYDDDPRWADVPDHHLVAVTGGAVTLTDLENADSRMPSSTDPMSAPAPGPPGVPRRRCAPTCAAGLTATPKTLPPKYFYDARGSELFDEITRLPEYYPTRAETRDPDRSGPARSPGWPGASRWSSWAAGPRPRPGCCCGALRAAGTLREFVPFDVDPAVLAEASAALAAEYPGLRIAPFVGDFEQRPGRDPRPTRRPARMIAFLGSTIGNLEPAARAAFLRQVARGAAAGRHLPARHRPGQGRRPAAARLRRRGGRDGRVQPQRAARWSTGSWTRTSPWTQFEHVALWDAGREWIEMRLRSAVRAAGHGRATWT